jgi:23S rRNA pseudouridine1911/1915/1917 synthase
VTDEERDLGKESIELEVDERFAGERLDRALAAMLDDRSRTLIQKHIEAGAVTVDGARPPRGSKTKLELGARIRYEPPPPEPLDLVPEPIPLSILFEDEHLIVVDKPANLVVHPALGHWRGTLVNAVLHHTKSRLDGVGPEDRPGIVHRLDRDTTGAIVVAKTPRAHELLARAFADRQVEKTYLAVTGGVPAPAAATFDTEFGRHPRDRKRFSSRVTGGKRAVTHYAVLERFASAALVEVRLETGRTHQIRVHFSDHGWPLLGDRVYGGRPGGIERPALHAARLAFRHPIAGGEVRCDAPVPADFVELLRNLRSEAP